MSNVDLEPGQYSVFTLDSIVPYTGELAEVMHDDVVLATFDALERHVLALMVANEHTVVDLERGVLVGQRVAPPEGWLMVRAQATVREFDTEVDSFDVEVE